MASFCIATKMSPSEYRKLTLAEYQAFMDVLLEKNDEGGIDLEELI